MNHSGTLTDPVMLKITGSSVASANIWDYTAEYAIWASSGSISGVSLEALNIWEKGNTSGIAMGLATNTGSTLQPVPTGAYVLAWFSAADTKWLFVYPNQWECDP